MCYTLQLWETSRGRVVKAYLVKCLPKKSAKSTTSQRKRSSLSATISNEGNTNSSLVEHNLDSAIVLKVMHPNNRVSEVDGRINNDSPRHVTNPTAVLRSTILEILAPKEDMEQVVDDN